ncbi:VanZ family protein [Streptomyces sp. NPDC087219]|uniref:VanZ family protein n=1 Tax=Streptomyces sp. NPDC087219 TaxID=3365770 RepID=UPI0038107B2F
MGLLLSLSIEGTQWVLAAGRVVDIDDVIVNSAGAALGALICVIGGRLVPPARRGHQRRAVPAHRRR